MPLRKESLKVSHTSTKFGGHWHCDSGDIVDIVYHMVLKDHVIKVSFDFLGGIPSR